MSSPSIQVRNLYLPAAVAATLLLHALVPFDGWIILVVGLGGAWLTSAYWALSLYKGLRFDRELGFDWAQVGDQLVERLTVYNDGWLPALWVRVLDQSDVPGTRSGIVTDVDGGLYKSWIQTTDCERRGIYRFGPTRIETSDPFGFFQLTLQDGASSTLLVTPPVIDLPSIRIAPGERVGEGKARVNAPEPTVSVAGVREFVPGDDLRSIHWRTSARRQSWYVRTFDNTPSSAWWILLDLNSGVQRGIGADSTLEHSVILAASIAHRGVQQNLAVGLTAYGSQRFWLPPRTGNPQRREILKVLATIGTGSMSLRDLIGLTQPALGWRTSLIIITPDLSTDWIGSLSRLIQREITPTVLLLDPSKYEAGQDPSTAVAAIRDRGIHHHLIDPNTLQIPRYDAERQPRLDRVIKMHASPSTSRPLGGKRWKVLK